MKRKEKQVKEGEEKDESNKNGKKKMLEKEKKQQ